jgi:hypothetical protein
MGGDLTPESFLLQDSWKVCRRGGGLEETSNIERRTLNVEGLGIGF